MSMIRTVLLLVILGVTNFFRSFWVGKLLDRGHGSGSGLQSCKLEGMIAPWHANHAYITLAPYTTLSCEATPGRTSSSMTKTSTASIFLSKRE